MSGVTLAKVYEQIDEQRSVLINLLNMSKANPLPPNRLSDVCMKLSILNELLGGFLADLKYDQIMTESKAFEKARVRGITVTESSAVAREESAKQRREYEKAFTKHKDLWSLISMAQTHIRAEGDERKGM